MHAKVFSIQILQYFRQISPRVCTLVLFIIDSMYGHKFFEVLNFHGLAFSKILRKQFSGAKDSVSNDTVF